MLMRMLKSLSRGAERADTRDAGSPNHARNLESPPERAERLNRAHAAAGLERHMEIAYGDLRVGNRRLLDLVRDCHVESETHTPPGKALHRPLASYFLAHYFLHALNAEGEYAECGVFQGMSALLLCRVAQSRDARYMGSGLHLIDSFAGLDDPTSEDHFEVRSAEGNVTPFLVEKGAFAAPIERCRSTLKSFPEVAYHKGWIPAVFETLTATQWSFVHLDVDHYEPTYTSLAYFYPRLARGGVIVCDDYGAPMFPGAHRAWNRFCDEHGVPYVVLDTGQSVILKS
jgi:hypothetical protein